MEKKIIVKCWNERYRKYYKLAQYRSGQNFYCYEIESSGFSDHLKDIGEARNYEDAISIIRSDALMKYGAIEKVEIEDY